MDNCYEVEVMAKPKLPQKLYIEVGWEPPATNYCSYTMMYDTVIRQIYTQDKPVIVHSDRIIIPTKQDILQVFEHIVEEMKKEICLALEPGL